MSRYSYKHSKDFVNNLLNSSSSSSQTEQDRRISPCTVDLYVRPVEGFGHNVAKHWVLYFQWHHFDESYEANEDEDGYLVPIAYDGKPMEVKNLKYKVTRIKTDFRIYPDTVRDIARKNKFNKKKYDALTCSCQSWVRELGKQLKLKLPDSQVSEGVEIAATVAAVAGVVGVIIGGVVKAVSSRK